MNRTVLPIAGALAVLVASAPAFAQGGRDGGRSGGGATPRDGGIARPNRPSGPRAPAGRDGRANRGPDRRSDSPRTQRHRDRNGDGRPDRHHHHRPRIWWPYFGGIGLSPFGYQSPFYDPFYNGFYNYEAFDADTGSAQNITVRVKPENARVLVNGLLYSGKGKTSFNLPAGVWTVEITAPGYRSEIISLNVEQGVRYRIERKLEKDPTRDQRGKALKEEALPIR